MLLVATWTLAMEVAKAVKEVMVQDLEDQVQVEVRDRGLVREIQKTIAEN
jgi:hypothetical protein